MEPFTEQLSFPWKDITSHSQKSKDRASRAWSARFGNIQLLLTRHRDFGPNSWTYYCLNDPNILPLRPAASQNVEEVANEVLKRSRLKLTEALIVLDESSAPLEEHAVKGEGVEGYDTKVLRRCLK